MRLHEIIEDLNVSICDVETLSLNNPAELDLKRAVGQLKAARASLCRIAVQSKLWPSYPNLDSAKYSEADPKQEESRLNPRFPSINLNGEEVIE